MVLLLRLITVFYFTLISKIYIYEKKLDKFLILRGWWFYTAIPTQTRLRPENKTINKFY